MDVIQFINHTLPATPAIHPILCVARRRCRPVSACEPVREELVDRLCAPVRRGQRGGGAHGTQEVQGSGELHVDLLVLGILRCQTTSS